MTVKSHLVVRIDYTVRVDDEYRCAIRTYYGQAGMAGRDEVKRWMEQYGASMDDDLARDYWPRTNGGDAA